MMDNINHLVGVQALQDGHTYQAGFQVATDRQQCETLLTNMGFDPATSQSTATALMSRHKRVLVGMTFGVEACDGFAAYNEDDNYLLKIVANNEYTPDLPMRQAYFVIALPETASDPRMFLVRPYVEHGEEPHELDKYPDSWLQVVHPRTPGGKALLKAPQQSAPAPGRQDKAN